MCSTCKCLLKHSSVTDNYIRKPPGATSDYSLPNSSPFIKTAYSAHVRLLLLPSVRVLCFVYVRRIEIHVRKLPCAFLHARSCAHVILYQQTVTNIDPRHEMEMLCRDFHFTHWTLHGRTADLLLLLTCNITFL